MEDYQKYDYRGLAGLEKWVLQVGGATGCLVLTILVGLYLYAVDHEPGSLLVAILLSLLFLLFGCWLNLGLANMYPTVWVGDDALTISYNLGSVKIRWEDVVNIRTCHVGWLHCSAVEAREITRFHLFYIIYTRSTWPAFLIRSDIQDYLGLLSEIKQRAQKASWLFASNQESKS